MMISNIEYTQSYVWIWLPQATEPVVAGKLTQLADRIVFNYGQSYLNRDNAIAIYDKELPLKAGIQESVSSTERMAGCIRDSAPDAWGRRVILNKLLGIKSKETDPSQLNELTYLMESGSDRIGALDFQASSNNYQPRYANNSKLTELLQFAELVERGIPVNQELTQALNHGTSIGGARPKALLSENDKKYIAKFSSSSDIYNVIKAEFVAMRLAHLCGLNVATVKLTKTSGKDVLLIERFDRENTAKGWARKHILSALTLMGLDEMTARYASYEDFAEIIRHRFAEPKKTLKEMFSRIVFNILCGNTDDHARNHAAFWDGKQLSLTPAYDICPQLRAGGEATQAMMITGNDRSSKLSTCLSAAKHFMLTPEHASDMIDNQITTIETHWHGICEQAQLSPIDQKLFKERLFMNRYAFEGYDTTSIKF
jgi:serine/threonine-protein kinase HipA